LLVPYEDPQVGCVGGKILPRWTVDPPAYHAAIALDAGVNACVSLDEDLRRVDGLIVYTCWP
jgi:hypothetical protein